MLMSLIQSVNSFIAFLSNHFLPVFSCPSRMMLKLPMISRGWLLQSWYWYLSYLQKSLLLRLHSLIRSGETSFSIDRYKTYGLS